jgi:hypothetical protein
MSEAVAAIGSDRDFVREQSVPEVEHLERAWVFGLSEPQAHCIGDGQDGKE